MFGCLVIEHDIFLRREVAEECAGGDINLLGNVLDTGLVETFHGKQLIGCRNEGITQHELLAFATTYFFFFCHAPAPSCQINEL
ncbi:hypothetical protein D3C77_650050 [compost metagenome]